MVTCLQNVLTFGEFKFVCVLQSIAAAIAAEEKAMTEAGKKPKGPGASIIAEEKAMAEAVKMTEAEEAMWTAAFKACPNMGKWGQKICPNGPQSCSRDPSAEEIMVMCDDYKNNKKCAASSFAKKYLAQRCAAIGGMKCKAGVLSADKTVTNGLSISVKEELKPESTLKMTCSQANKLLENKVVCK